MHPKKKSRLMRARRTRMHIRELGMDRLCVHRTPKHIYAQIIAAGGSEVRATASSLEKELRDQVSSNVEGAKRIGALIAERALAAGVETVAFDRSGFRYHGRVKALAEAAREGGLKF